MAERNHEAVKELKSYFDKNLSALKNEILNEQDTKTKKSSQKQLEFRYKSNQKQFEFNEEIKGMLETSIQLIQKGSKHRSVKKLKDATDLLNSRNKLVRIADKSPAGWGTVQGYESDSIASDSEDEKKIRKAENRALAKKRKRTVSSSTTSKRIDFGVQEGGLVLEATQEQTQPKHQMSVLNVEEEVIGSKIATSSQKKKNISKDKYYNFESKLCFLRKSEKAFFENVLTAVNNNSTVKGRIRMNIKVWEKLRASEYILQVIKEGYKLPFIKTPEFREFQNNHSAINNYNFVSTTIQELIQSGSVIEVPFCPLLVAVNSSGKKRLILDIRYINDHLYKEYIRFDD